MGLKFLDIRKLSLKNKISNTYFLNKLETSEEWIKTRTGIENRYFSEKSAAEMAVELSEKLIIDKSKVKLIIVASFTSNKSVPSIASLVHEKLNLNNDCLSFDINLACSGFVAMMILAEKILENKEQAIIIASEKITDVLDFSDRSTAILFGDGSAGAVVEKNNKLWISDSKTYGNGEALYINEKSYLQMQGKDVYRFAVDKVPESINKVITESNINKDDIEFIFSHQANIRIIEQLAIRSKIDKNKFLNNLKNYGNTSAASIPILLFENYKHIKNGDCVIFSAFGAGLNICSVLMEWE